MTILEKTPGLLDALRGAMTPKFAATRSADGVGVASGERIDVASPFLRRTLSQPDCGRIAAVGLRRWLEVPWRLPHA